MSKFATQAYHIQARFKKLKESGMFLCLKQKKSLRAPYFLPMLVESIVKH
jgi:hypothetical protein